MYNQFCKNLKHFIKIMDDDENSRKRTAEVLLQLTDIERYIALRRNGEIGYHKISNMIYELSQYSKNYPALKKFVWELWAYGFDIKKLEESETENYEIEELAKLADLMLSTHYFGSEDIEKVAEDDTDYC